MGTFEELVWITGLDEGPEPVLKVIVVVRPTVNVITDVMLVVTVPEGEVPGPVEKPPVELPKNGGEELLDGKELPELGAVTVPLGENDVPFDGLGGV